MKYLIGYDIANEKRLQHVHKKLTKFASAIQYSVFLFEGDLQQLTDCLQEILTIINKKEDDLRVYPIPSGAKQWRIGRTSLPEGIVWTMLPLALME